MVIVKLSQVVESIALPFCSLHNRSGGKARLLAHMAHTHAAGRVRQRIEDWLNAQPKGQKKGLKKRLAEAVPYRFGKPKSYSWVSDILRKSGKTVDVQLRDLDAIARFMGVPPGELVRRDEDHYVEVTASELRLLTGFRALPDAIRTHLMAYLDYVFGFQQRALGEQAAERDRRTTLARATRLAGKKAPAPPPLSERASV